MLQLRPVAATEFAVRLAVPAATAAQRRGLPRERSCDALPRTDLNTSPRARAGDLMGRKTNFVITSALIILGCLGAATASGGYLVGGNIGPDGLWADANGLPAGSWNDVYGQVRRWLSGVAVWDSRRFPPLPQAPVGRHACL